jgi:Domain of unknown function (DUF4357)
MPRPQTIQIFLPDGSPIGIKEADIKNKLPRVILFSRLSMDKAIKRELVKFSGIYFLFGEDNKGKSKVYIGEGENCWDRIKSHNRTKDFWTDCIIAVTKTNDYDKADTIFLEHLCIKKALKINRFDLINDKVTKEPSIQESRKYDLLENFETFKLLLATLGYPIFENQTGRIKESKEYFFCKGKKANAKSILTDEGVLVLSGSVANLKESPTAGSWVIGIRKKLIDDGTLLNKNNVLEFSSDQIFKSPSGAAATVLARRANGWKEWKDKDGKTLDELKRK